MTAVRALLHKDLLMELRTRES
ncbi:MAG: hypothetical protein QOD76_778, partial [Solirubrobacteraceae bacterium]|nr:hypothetical protein [Solirubrobacteraceae bacterium]